MNQTATELDSNDHQQQQQQQQDAATIASLEKQLAEAKKDSSDSTEHTAALATKDNRIMELEKQLSEAKKDSSDLIEHTAALATKDSRIMELEKQLSAMLVGSLAATNDHQQVMDVSVSSDGKRVRDIEEVNAILAAFANDEDFQSDLHREAVQAALTRCWDSRTARVRVPRQQGSSSARKQQAVDDTDLLNQSDISIRDFVFAMNNNNNDEKEEEDDEDEGYRRIEPLLREFEQVCDMARIAMPLSHLLSKKTFLSVEAVSAAYGEDFVNQHYRNNI